MPQAYVKELAKKHNISVQAAEGKWASAKKSADKEGHGDDFAYITGIFKKMMGESVSIIESKDYGVRYRHISPKGTITTKEKLFDTEKQLDAFVNKLHDSDGFLEVVSWLAPRVKESARDKVLRAVMLVQEAKVQEKLTELKASSFMEFLINEDNKPTNTVTITTDTSKFTDTDHRNVKPGKSYGVLSKGKGWVELDVGGKNHTYKVRSELVESGPFSYGSKKPKSAHGKEVAKKAKEYADQRNGKFEIKDDMVGVAKKTKVKESADNPGLGDFIKFGHKGDQVEGKVSRIGKDNNGKKFYTAQIVAGPQKGKVVSVFKEFLINEADIKSTITESEDETLDDILKKGKANYNSWYIGFYRGYHGKPYQESKADKHYKAGYKEGESAKSDDEPFSK